MGAARLLVTAALLGAISTPVFAADLHGYRGGSCVSASSSQLALLPADEIEVRVSDFYADAGDALASSAVVGSRSPAFLWARETRFQCGKALGYLEGGYIEEDVIAKCDCAHGRLMSFR